MTRLSRLLSAAMSLTLILAAVPGATVHGAKSSLELDPEAVQRAADVPHAPPSVLKGTRASTSSLIGRAVPRSETWSSGSHAAPRLSGLQSGDNNVDATTIALTIDSARDGSIDETGVLDNSQTDARHYVDHNAVGTGDGGSWANAYPALGTALAAAKDGEEIWVATGVYTPGLARTDTFSLSSGVAIYGGFPTGGGDGTFEARDWEAHPTVLSGDLEGDDLTDSNDVVTDTANIRGNNAYHVVTGRFVTQTAGLDGFIITAGKADGGFPNSHGGGMYVEESNPTLANIAFSGNWASSGGGLCNNSVSAPTLTGATFIGNQANRGGAMYNANGSNPELVDILLDSNRATGQGGGMYNYYSSPTLTRVIFSGNEARDDDGGGLYNDGGGLYNRNSNPTLRDATFSNNHAVGDGGAVCNHDSYPTFEDATFTGNSASDSGDGMENEGSGGTLTNVIFAGNLGSGMSNAGSSPTLTNAIFSGNLGGGMDNVMSSPDLINVIFVGNGGVGLYNFDSSPTLINVTFSGNHGALSNGQFSQPTLVNCILWGNGPNEISNYWDGSADITYSDVQWPSGVYTGTGNINSDPLFVAPGAGDWRLSDGSPAIDAGTNAEVTVDTDLDGNPRIADGTGDENRVVDMGAYEYPEALLTIVKQGEGLVTGTPGTIDCGSACTAGFLAGTQTTLTATADAGWAFADWSGDVESTDNPLVVTVQDHTVITATFTTSQAYASISLDPPTKTAYVGQAFELTILVHSAGEPVDGAEAHLDFDPSVLEVVHVEGGSALPIVLQNQYDNDAGTIDYSAGLLTGDPPTGTFTLATAAFHPITEKDSTTVSFTFTPPRRTDLAYQGESVLGGHGDAQIVVELGAQLNGTVDLQGRPTPPDPAWSVPLTLTLHPPGGGDPLYILSPTTDESGAFTLPAITPGSYEARVKAMHTLANRKAITLTSGPTDISFGTLLEGDANGDNCITILDFSLLRTAFGTCSTDDGFDARADFNEDGCITILDFSLLRTNFGLCGDIEVGAPQAAWNMDGTGSVSIGLVPTSTVVAAGHIFTLPIQIMAGAQPVDGAEAHLDFDPEYLRVVDSGGTEAGTITPVTTRFDTVLQNQVNNAAGSIDYAAGVLTGDPPTGTFTLGSIRFRAITETEATALTFAFANTRRTEVAFEGASVLGDHFDGQVTITPGRKLYLPLVLSERTTGSEVRRRRDSWMRGYRITDAPPPHPAYNVRPVLR